VKILGALFAGGQSRRFGSDKALALWQGQPLLVHALVALQKEVPQVIVCGRDWPGVTSVADLHPGLGPLAALESALDHAAARGFTHVLTSACDIPYLPQGLVQRLSPAPAVLSGQPLVGLWPSRLAPALSQSLADGARRMQDWAAQARDVDLGPLPNINTQQDLARL
jgi:molybdopterin-guanine dinucleotide biosynthesis protein A